LILAVLIDSAAQQWIHPCNNIPQKVDVMLAAALH
jgi:hypothetical protein